MSARLLIGAGSGFAGDRVDPAIAVVDALSAHGAPGFLIYETLAERTLALAQQAGGSRTAVAERFLEPILGACLTKGIRIVGNFGGSDPLTVARRVAAMGRKTNRMSPRVAAIVGDDLLAALGEQGVRALDLDLPLDPDDRVVAANAYIGADPIRRALDDEAQIVVAGRVSDPSLALGPVLHVTGARDHDSLAHGTLAGHLLECAGQVTGGYFAVPGLKDVDGLDDMGFPIAEIDDGDIVIGKPSGTGGRVDCATVKEQILYEIHDPAAYLTPDITLDITAVDVEAAGVDRVRVRGARGFARPATLKATICFENGWLAESEISYAGHRAFERAKLAIDIVRRRMGRFAPGLAVRADIVGVASVFADDAGLVLEAWRGQPPDDVRARFALRARDRKAAERLIEEVEGLYTNGPAGGGGVRSRLERSIATSSALVDRDIVRPTVVFAEDGQ